jgi:hypothetical protein
MQKFAYTLSMDAMKKLLIVPVMVLASFFAQNAMAQGKPFDFINVGVGVSTWGIPIFAGVDFQVEDQITVGGQLNYRRYTERYNWQSNRIRWTHNILEVSANANYHFFEPGEDYDVYAGISAGYYIWSTRLRDRVDGFDEEYIGDGVGGLGLRIQLGGRYVINDDIILYGEIGGGNRISGARIGVSFPF